MQQFFGKRKIEIAEKIANKSDNFDYSAKSHGLVALAMFRFRQNKLSIISLYVLIIIIIATIVVPWILPWGYEDIFWDKIKAGPEGGHLFGFDVVGRDLLARSMSGTRVSLQVALIATSVSVFVGVAWGSIAGFFGGRVDEVMMRFVDVMYAMPYILFVILLMVIFGRNEYLLYLGIGLIEWVTMARIVRGQTLSIKEKEYVMAARASGVTPLKIIAKHVAPNLSGPVLIYATLTVPEIILTESFLSFLGFGVQEPRTSLGTLISDGADKFDLFPWMLFAPGAILITILFCLIFIGEGLRDAFDPKDR